MFKIITAILFLVFSNACFSVDMRSYDGIWQDVGNSRNYYTIQEKDNKVVLINLSGIEISGNTLKSAYIGNTVDFIMTRVSPESPAKDIYNQLKLEFQSPSEGLVYPVCDTCSVIAIKIRKIF